MYKIIQRDIRITIDRYLWNGRELDDRFALIWIEVSPMMMSIVYLIIYCYIETHF